MVLCEELAKDLLTIILRLVCLPLRLGAGLEVF